MARYTVVHNCGHTSVATLFGKHDERERKIAWMETTDCTECWKKEQEAKRAAASVAAAEEAKQQALPKLEGTEKQIAWAETIRAEHIKAMKENYLSKIEQVKDPVVKKIIVDIVNERMGEKSAKAWIDSRSTNYGNAWIMSQIDAAKKEIKSTAQAATMPVEIPAAPTPAPEFELSAPNAEPAPATPVKKSLAQNHAERAEIAMASYAAAESFMLGGDPLDNLTGQTALFI